MPEHSSNYHHYKFVLTNLYAVAGVVFILPAKILLHMPNGTTIAAPKINSSSIRNLPVVAYQFQI